MSGTLGLGEYLTPYFKDENFLHGFACERRFVSPDTATIQQLEEKEKAFQEPFGLYSIVCCLQESDAWRRPFQ